ncbi:MAG TPA: hypothetical protein VM686_22385 [Polyangiaceae bacterium]|nr:hypothetical protein [Polyangiaceae bacterium]
MVTSLALGAGACARVAQVPPQELTKLNGHTRGTGRGPVQVELVSGSSVSIRPDYSKVQVDSLGADGWMSFDHFRAPVSVNLADGVLEVSELDREEPRRQRYRLSDVRATEIVQRDPSRARPLIIGVVVGAVIGGAFATGYGAVCPARSDGEHCAYWPVGWAMVGGVLGGGAGVLIALPFSSKYYR